MATPAGYVNVLDLPTTQSVTDQDSVIVIKNAGQQGQYAARLSGSDLGSGGGGISNAVLVIADPNNKLMPPYVGKYAYDTVADKLYISVNFSITGWQLLW